MIAAAPGRSRAMNALLIACVLIGSLYLAKAVYRGLSFTQGDFYYSLPGLYAQRLNPTLWNSPDLRSAEEFNHGAYMYGPTEYLTLFPIVFLDSYRTIASTLLVAYVGVLLLACYFLWVLLARAEPGADGLGPVIFAIVFAFLPLGQVLIQREFEAVAWLALVVACLLFVRGRDVASGAALAYLAWFKYWPVVLLGTFVMHRRFKGLAAFAAASAVLLAATQLIFGLQHFRIGRTLGIVGGLMRPLGSGEVLYPVIERGALKSDFCRQWVWGRGTAADVRWALCGVEDRFPWLPAKAAFYLIVVVTAALFVWAAWRLASEPRDRRDGEVGRDLGVQRAGDRRRLVRARALLLLHRLPAAADGAGRLVHRAAAAVAPHQDRAVGRELPAAERVHAADVVAVGRPEAERVEPVSRQRRLPARPAAAAGPGAVGTRAAADAAAGRAGDGVTHADCR